MRIVLDTETNALVDPTHVWLVVCKDMDTGNVVKFRNLTTDPVEAERFLHYAQDVTLWTGHNWLGFDYPVLNRLLGLVIANVADVSIDTLIVSKLVDYSREGGHSIEQYGREFGLEKGDFTDFSKLSPEMEVYCERDVEICYRIFRKYYRYISNPERRASIIVEHKFQLVINDLHTNGFGFNRDRAVRLLSHVMADLGILDKEILEAFPPRQKLIREFTPKATKHGTISKSSVPRSLWDRMHEFTIGNTYPVYRTDAFNPSSPTQIVEVLNEAGWKPEDKTKTHITCERDLQRLKRDRTLDQDAIQVLETKLLKLRRTGWMINERNLSTLPPSAPAPARTLAKRILLESRRKTLTEWLGLFNTDTGRIHGSFYGIGAWTQRMAHQNPNTANIPNEYDTFGMVKLLGKDFRKLWIAPKNRLLCGVDAEGIQLRIFAHYIDDKEFTDALVNGKKEDKSDPHSLNQRVLGSVCKSRAAAKRFIYALLLGAGRSKLAEILGATESQTESALDLLMQRYQGWARLKADVIPTDAKRGWFTGLDGRAVKIKGDTQGARRHLCMSGYLQNGEAVVMKHATLKWHDKLKEFDAKLVNFVHDEWQTECPNDVDLAIKICKMQADSLRIVGEELKLKCPLAGSYWNDDHKDYTIGTNWYATH